jgi:hypothetical protein
MSRFRRFLGVVLAIASLPAASWWIRLALLGVERSVGALVPTILAVIGSGLVLLSIWAGLRGTRLASAALALWAALSVALAIYTAPLHAPTWSHLGLAGYALASLVYCATTLFAPRRESERHAA